MAATAAAGNENHKGPIAAGGTEQRQRGNIPPTAATGLFLKLPRSVRLSARRKKNRCRRALRGECGQTKDVATDGRTNVKSWGHKEDEPRC